MRFATFNDGTDFIMRTRRRLGYQPRGMDDITRDITQTRDLLLATGLLDRKREYVVITGSKGKGSTASITARLLQSLGHRTGFISSPHLVHWTERIRVDGNAIPEEDLLRILNDLAPTIEAQEKKLIGHEYISPQGIILLIALAWFDEQDVTAAVVEVGRGGRYDDMSLVPNMVSLFTPIFLEHTQYLGDTVERIAWHKAGIIKPGSFAYSVPQAPEVLNVLQTESDAKHAEFYWLSQLDMGVYLGDTPTGVRMSLHRYGELELSLLGRYEVENATLAVQAAGNMHSRLKGISHSSPEYVERIRQGLANVNWPGRVHLLETNPMIFVDGATNVPSLRYYLESIESRCPRPWIGIAGIPTDRDYPGIYRELSARCDGLIITSSDIHPGIHFPDADTALSAAREVGASEPHYAERLPDAIDLARRMAGSEGSIIMSVAQPLVGEAMLIWKVPTRDI